MRSLVTQFIDHRVSRRTFVQSLAALGMSGAGIESTVRAAEAAVAGDG